MEFTDQSIVLSSRAHAESAGVVRVLTRDHGVYGGIVRAISGKTQRGTWQPGNRVLIRWNARLAEHLGHFTGELLEPTAAMLLNDAGRLHALTSATTLIELSVAEREPHPELF